MPWRSASGRMVPWRAASEFTLPVRFVFGEVCALTVCVQSVQGLVRLDAACASGRRLFFLMWTARQIARRIAHLITLLPLVDSFPSCSCPLLPVRLLSRSHISSTRQWVDRWYNCRIAPPIGWMAGGIILLVQWFAFGFLEPKGQHFDTLLCSRATEGNTL